MIDVLDNNGFYLKYIEPKADGFFKTIFPISQTGGIFDKYWLDETPFEIGDVLKLTIIPRGEDKLMVKIEYKWEDQVVE
jgi:hypothetical protein